MSILVTRDISRYFGGLQAVNEVSLQMNEGEILGLIGPNGSGKTTFINVVSGILKPTAGKIIFREKEITGLPAHVLARRGIARTFQQNTLFKDLTVLENVLAAHEISYKKSAWLSIFGSSSSRIEEAKARESTLSILEDLNILEWKDKVCNNLPHGIQRMVDIAIAVALRPKVMLLDEPFTGMNLGEIANMVDVIMRLKKNGVAILLVEHRVKVVMEICDRIVVLNFGRKIAEGLPKEVRENEEVVKGYLGEEHDAF